MFITRRQINRPMSGLGQEPERRVIGKAVVTTGHDAPHWLVQTVVGSLVSAVVFMVMWKKFM